MRISSSHHRAHQCACDGGAEDRPPWPRTLHDFELDALNMIVLLEHNVRALWLDIARAKEHDRSGPRPQAGQSRRDAILPIGKSIQMDVSSPDLKTKLVIIAFIG